MPTMTGGSDDARAPHEERTSVDAAWDELLGESDEDEVSGQRGAQPVSAGHASARRPDADDEMARLMGGEAPRLPALDAESTRIVVQEAAPVEPKVGSRSQPLVAAAAEPKESKLDAAATEPIVARGVTLASEPEVVRETPQEVVRKELAVEREPVRQAAAAVSPKPVVAHEEPAKPRASRPSLKVVEVGRVEPAPAASVAEGGKGLPWAWIGLGAIALGAAAYFATRDEGPASDRRQATVAPAPAGTPREPVQAGGDSSASASGDTASSDATTGPAPADSGDLEGNPPTTSRKGDPREPPPDTPPEIAAVFRRLPVGPADRPPVGGIGATGIHVDHIAMGTETQDATCRGRADDFSVSAGDRAGVCVRVVHSREKEELQVLWQKHGGSTRRSKMVVLPMHAYRTRGILVLRSEYIGDWTVRILSSDGVELARHEFTVVP